MAGEYVIQMGCHSYSLASPDSDSYHPPFRITHAEGSERRINKRWIPACRGTGREKAYIIVNIVFNFLKMYVVSLHYYVLSH